MPACVNSKYSLSVNQKVIHQPVVIATKARTTRKPAKIAGFQCFWCDQTCKPSSVVNSHLSWPDVTIAARCHLLGTRRADASCSSAVLLRIGFAEPRGLPRAGELLPRLSTLTVSGGISLLHFPWGRPRRPLAVILPCGARTFLGHALSDCVRSCSACSHIPF